MSNPTLSDDPRVVRTYRDVAQAVRDLIIEDGWDAVTHQRVAEYAGYSRNTLYRHFPDRIDLFRHAGGFDDAVLHASRTGDTRTDLTNELHAFREVLVDGPLAVILATLMERAVRDDTIAPMRDELVRLGTDFMRTTIEDGKQRGDIDSSRDTEDLVSLLCGPLLHDRLARNRPTSDAFIAQLVDLATT